MDALLSLCDLLFLSVSQKIEPFASSCSAAISTLQQSIDSLGNSGNLKTSKVRHAHTHTHTVWIYDLYVSTYIEWPSAVLRPAQEFIFQLAETNLVAP